MCGSRRVAEAGDEKWRGCAWDGAPRMFHSHAGEGTQSPHSHELTWDSLEIDQGKNPQSPTDNSTMSSRESETAGEPAGAVVPTVRCKEAELCPVRAGRWPRGPPARKCGQLRASPRRHSCK
ncbi:hypothetical protein NN561_016282 [Cricetulus griseus]